MEKIVWLLFLTISFKALAKSPELDLTIKKNHESPPLRVKMSYSDYFDEGYNFLSKKVYLLSNTVDAIFTERSINDEKNKSYFRLWYEMSKSEGQDLVSRPDFRLRLYLKETRKRLRFTFDNTSRAQDTQSQLSQTQATVATRNEEKSLSASIGVNLKESDKFNITTSGGIRLGIPPNLFFRSNVRYNDKYGDIDVSAANSFFYYSLDGFGNTTNLNFLYKFNDRLRLIYESFGTWLEPRRYNAGTGFQLFYAYNDKWSFNSQLGMNANKDFGRFMNTDYFISSGARRLLYRDWFYVEITPSIRWSRENEWKHVGNIYVRFEAFIGGNN